jgi:hypothetical protein
VAWSTIRKIPLGNIRFIAQKEAKVLNRRIYELGKLRAEIDAGNVPTNHGRAGEPIDEAIRRELILRHDVIAFCKANGLEHADHVEHMGAARRFLDNRGTHSSHHRRA